jgi:diaminopropionate ammonia-lyase
MRMLSSPLKGDSRVISGESGAVGLGLLASLGEENRRMLGIDEDSVVLLFSTEGDTDPDKYKEIVWNGAYGSYGL